MTDQAISYQAAPAGIPVLTATGAEIGTLEHVLQIPEEDLFDGLVVATKDGLRFVDADQVQLITAVYIRSTLDDDAARHLPAPDGPPVYRVDAIEGHRPEPARPPRPPVPPRPLDPGLRRLLTGPLSDNDAPSPGLRYDLPAKYGLPKINGSVGDRAVTTEPGLATEPEPAPELVTEQDLAADVLDALLRENFAGLSDRVGPDGPDGAALRLGPDALDSLGTRRRSDPRGDAGRRPTAGPGAVHAADRRGGGPRRGRQRAGRGVPG